MSSSYSSGSNHDRNRCKKNYHRSRRVADDSDESEKSSSPVLARRYNDRVKYSSRSSSYKHEHTRKVLYESRSHSRRRGRADEDQYTIERRGHNENHKYTSNKEHSNSNDYYSSNRHGHTESNRSRIHSPEIVHSGGSSSRVPSRRNSSYYEEDENRRIKSSGRYLRVVDSKRYNDKNHSDLAKDDYYSRSGRELDDRSRERYRRENSSDLSRSSHDRGHSRNRVVLSSRKRHLSPSPPQSSNRGGGDRPRYHHPEDNVIDSRERTDSRRSVRDESRLEDDYYQQQQQQQQQRYERRNDRDLNHDHHHHHNHHHRDARSPLNDDRKAYHYKPLHNEDDLLDAIRRRRRELFEKESLLDSKRLLLDNGFLAGAGLLFKRNREIDKQKFYERLNEAANYGGGRIPPPNDDNNAAVATAAAVNQHRNNLAAYHRDLYLRDFAKIVAANPDAARLVAGPPRGGNLLPPPPLEIPAPPGSATVTTRGSFLPPPPLELPPHATLATRGGNLLPPLELPAAPNVARANHHMPPLELPNAAAAAAAIAAARGGNHLTPLEFSAVAVDITTTTTTSATVPNTADHYANHYNDYHYNNKMIARSWRDYRRYNINNINNNNNNNSRNDENARKKYVYIREQVRDKNKDETPPTPESNTNEQLNKVTEDVENSSSSSTVNKNSAQLSKEDAATMSQSGLSDISDNDDNNAAVRDKNKECGIELPGIVHNESEASKLDLEETSTSDKLHQQQSENASEGTIEEDLNEYSVIDELTVDIQKDDDKQSVEDNDDSEDETDLFTVSRVSDVLGVDWECLVAESKQDISVADTCINVRERWDARSIFDRIGVSLKYAGDSLFEELNEELANRSSDEGDKCKKIEESTSNNDQQTKTTPRRGLLHGIAGMHTALKERTKKRSLLFEPYKKAVSLRKDIAIRRQLNNLPVKNFELQKTVGLCDWII